MNRIGALPLMVMLFMLVSSPFLKAQQESEPKPLRFDFTPFVGYRTSMSFPIEPHVSGTNPRVVLDASPSYGFSFGARLTGREEDLIEVRWARQDSYVHAEELDVTPVPLRQRFILDQFHGDFSHEPWIEEWPNWIRPYVLGSVGATHISAGSSISSTRFSFGLGAGIRFYQPTRHLGFKIQGEWLPVFADPQIAFVCGGGCIVHVGGTAASQGEVFFGTFWRF
jgi:hypothetical protein